MYTTMYTTTPPARAAADAPGAFGHAPGARYTAPELANLEAARRFLAAIEAGTAAADADPDAALAYYAPDARQVEFPNRFLPAGAERDLAALRAAAERGRGVLRAQRFEVRAAYAAGDAVILEVLWAGTLAVPVGALAPGDEMRAHFAVFLEFRGGRVWRHRTYDCFEPF